MKTHDAVDKAMRLLTGKELQRIADKLLGDSYGSMDACEYEDIMDTLERVDVDTDELIVEDEP